MVRSDLEKARKHAYRLISFRPRSQKEIRERLRRKGYNREVVDRLTHCLKEEGLIDDRRFAQQWTAMRSQKLPRSLSLIKVELLSKGIDREVVDETIDGYSDGFNEEGVARQLLQKRLRLMRGVDIQKKKMRLFGFLKRRGFSSELIYKLLCEL